MAAEETQASVLNGKTFAEQEAGAELFIVTCSKPSEHNINIGQYKVKWKR